MDLSADNNKPDERRRSHPLLGVAQIFRNFISRLMRAFTVTEEEQLEAGIIFGAKARD